MVTKIEKEQKLIQANKKLIEVFEGKIEERVGRVYCVIVVIIATKQLRGI